MTPTQREAALRLAEPVALLWQLRHALALASAICDAVPNRDPGHLGVLVNAQPDGTHGYRLIQDAEAALVEYLTTPTSAEPQGEPVAAVTECEACFTPDVCQLRGKCDHYAASQLRVTKQAHPPQQRKPLSESHIDQMIKDYAAAQVLTYVGLHKFARAIERAHDIKETP